MLIKASDDMVFNFDYVTKISTEDNWIRFYSQNCIGYFCQIDNMTIDEFLKLYLEAKKKNELFLDLTKPETMPISLEVGKTYITRGGDDVTITRTCYDTSYPFAGTLGVTIRYYTPKGEYFAGSETDFDIIGEKSA
jgi:hypothetical protein